MMVIMKNRGNVVGLFVGHDHPMIFLQQDHDNDMNKEQDYKGLYMAYGRKTGFGGYGIPRWQRMNTKR